MGFSWLEKKKITEVFCPTGLREAGERLVKVRAKSQPLVAGGFGTG